MGLPPPPLPPTCFGEGTLILTANDYVPIENLDLGDLVFTLAGDYKPIKWIGRRKLDFTVLQRPEIEQNLPILFSDSSLGPGVPFCDLIISQRHVIAHGDRAYVTGDLINDSTIYLMRDVSEVIYYHIEFEAKEIILANGVMAESYIDCGNRIKFDSTPTK